MFDFRFVRKLKQCFPSRPCSGFLCSHSRAFHFHRFDSYVRIPNISSIREAFFNQIFWSNSFEKWGSTVLDNNAWSHLTVWKQMSSDSPQNEVTDQLFAHKLYIYIYCHPRICFVLNGYRELDLYEEPCIYVNGNTITSFARELNPTGVGEHIYIYIYCHPQTDLFHSIRTHQCG